MNYEESILAYLRGELSDADQLAFEAELKRNTALATELARQRQSWELLGNIAAFEQQKTELSTWLAEAEQQKAEPIRRKLSTTWLVGIAAAIALLLAFIFIFPFSHPSHQELFATYYQTYEVGQLMGDPQLADSTFDQGVAFYQQDMWPEAIKSLSSLSANHPKYTESQLLIGIAYIQQEQYAAAIPYFSTINQDPNYGDQARWYQSLAHLMAGQVDEGKALLAKIKASQGYKHREASELLSKW